jgi:iron complex outermembrane receptor protein
MGDNSTPAHNVEVYIKQLAKATTTDLSGIYEFKNLPPGKYDVMAHLHALTDETQNVEVRAGEIVTLDFRLTLSPIKQEITVTASGRQETAFDAFQAVNSIESMELTARSRPSLGDVLEYESGVAKRSFGPGSSRPVIRGFDGDRVLIMQDEVPTGTLSSQSGDHGDAVDTMTLERLEVVKGPATLLYGSNAIGGVVNAVSRHHNLFDHDISGLRGYLSGGLGSNNGYGAASGGFEWGKVNWHFWGNGGGQRSGDYSTPLGMVPNSKSRISDGMGGIGWHNENRFYAVSYGLNNGRYGVPYAAQFEGEEGEVDLQYRLHTLKLNGGFRNFSSRIDQFHFTVAYTDWLHKELADNLVGTQLANRQFSFRGELHQHQMGRLGGTIGFSGLARSYEATGEETLSPPVDQNGFALFALEELGWEKVRFQVGARLEHQGYNPTGLEDRSFTGFSGAAGVNFNLWKGGAFVANFAHAYRAPALEELYNHGPHTGNLTYEIGNPDLKRERSQGLDLSLRHSVSRFRGEANLFYYRIADFVYLAPTGEMEEGLRVACYSQGESRFLGAELKMDFGLLPNLWLLTGMDSVNAKLSEAPTPLPRIPPIRGKFGLDAHARGFSFRPEAILAHSQDLLFPGETRTAGYALFNFNASYTLVGAHTIHAFSMDAFNLGNRLYRNHLSFIKDLAPEIGRGIRFTYSMNFF